MGNQKQVGFQNCYLLRLLMVLTCCLGFSTASAKPAAATTTSYIPWTTNYKPKPVKGPMNCEPNNGRDSTEGAIAFLRDPVVDWRCFPETEVKHKAEGQETTFWEYFNNNPEMFGTKPNIRVSYDKESFDKFYESSKNGERLLLKVGSSFNTFMNSLHQLGEFRAYLDQKNNPAGLPDFLKAVREVHIVYNIDKVARLELKNGVMTYNTAFKNRDGKFDTLTWQTPARMCRALANILPNFGIYAQANSTECGLTGFAAPTVSKGLPAEPKCDSSVNAESAISYERRPIVDWRCEDQIRDAEKTPNKTYANLRDHLNKFANGQGDQIRFILDKKSFDRHFENEAKSAKIIGNKDHYEPLDQCTWMWKDFFYRQGTENPLEQIYKLKMGDMTELIKKAKNVVCSYSDDKDSGTVVIDRGMLRYYINNKGNSGNWRTFAKGISEQLDFMKKGLIKLRQEDWYNK